MNEPFGLIRLQALPAQDVWHAGTHMALYAVAPRSTATVRLNAAGLRPGDVAGLLLWNRPYGWIGVERSSAGLTLAHFDEQNGRTNRVRLRGRRVWLRAEFDFVTRKVALRYSTDGRAYAGIGGERPLAAQGVSCSLFSRATAGEGGHADFDSFVMATERARQQDARR